MFFWDTKQKVKPLRVTLVELVDYLMGYLAKLTGELVDEMGPAGFLLRATHVYLRANTPELCDRGECERRVDARTGELAMRAVMDVGQPNVLGRAITSLTEYAQAVCRHPDEEFLLVGEELAVATV